MALIDVNQKNVHIAHLLKHLPVGHWDVYQVSETPTQVVLVHHDVRNRLGYRIVDTIIRSVSDGVYILDETITSFGWLSKFCKQKDLDIPVEKWLENNRAVLSEFKLISIEYADPVVLRFLSDFRVV